MVGVDEDGMEGEQKSSFCNREDPVPTLPDPMDPPPPAPEFAGHSLSSESSGDLGSRRSLQLFSSLIHFY